MAVTGINSEDRLVQATFAAHLKDKLGWDSVTAWNDETFGPVMAVANGQSGSARADRAIALCAAIVVSCICSSSRSFRGGEARKLSSVVCGISGRLLPPDAENRNS